MLRLLYHASHSHSKKLSQAVPRIVVVCGLFRLGAYNGGSSPSGSERRCFSAVNDTRSRFRSAASVAWKAVWRINHFDLGMPISVSITKTLHLLQGRSIKES